MRSDEGYSADGARIDRSGRDPGSRRSRLANASKQLGVVMEDVDLDDEPELAEALTAAVIAVDRASRQVSDRSARGPDRGNPHERADDVRGTAREGPTPAPLTVGRGEPAPGGSEPE